MKYSLSHCHFKFVFLLNALLFVSYTFLRVVAAIKLLFFDPEFTGVFSFHEPGCPQYTWGRVAAPTLLALLFFYWLRLFLKKDGFLADVSQFFRDLFTIQRPSLTVYTIFVGGMLAVLSLIPHFTNPLRHLDAQYAFADVDSYTSMIANLYRGDYNPAYEGGLPFGKYYVSNMPVLILLFLFGLDFIVPAQNIVSTALVFLSILNIAFTLRVLIGRKQLSVVEESGLIMLALGPIILLLRLPVLRDYFNYDGFLQTYANGFFGALGSSYLITCILFVFSYLTRFAANSWRGIWIAFTNIALFMVYSLHTYFNVALFLLPPVGVFLALLASKKTSYQKTLRAGILLGAFLLTQYGGFLALDVMPRRSMNPVAKLHLIMGGIMAVFLIAVVINRLFDNGLLKLFELFYAPVVLAVFAFPFFWWLGRAGDLATIELLGYPIKLGFQRFYFFYLIFYALLGSYFISLPLNFLRGKARWVGTLLLASSLLVLAILVDRTYTVHSQLPFEYPNFYPEDRVVMDRHNPYIFDDNGVKVTYNEYLVGVIKYFIREDVKDMYYWLVSRTPSQGIYEHGLMQRTLFSGGHAMEGLTIKDYASGEKEALPEWVQIRLNGLTIKTYDEFAENIFAIEEETRPLEGRFKNRYLILDNSFPAPRLAEMERSGLFRRVYENRLYKIYRAGQVKEQGGNTPPMEEETEQVISDGYLTQVVDWFRQGVTSEVRHWIILQPFPQKQLDRDLTQKALMSLGHKVARMEETGQMSIGEFAEEIFNWEQMSREGEERSEIEDRYVIVDSDFPSDHLVEMVGSGLFRKVYENRFYKIYRMEYFKYR